MPQIEWENLASLLSLTIGIFVAIALMAGWIPDSLANLVEQKCKTLSGRPVLCLIFLPTLSLVMSLFITIHKGMPEPVIHDEFSYLLAADTFAHGHITNPMLPFWESFETPQELMHPTYMSKYPPGQGIALAIGQRLIGKPIVGTWLSTAVAVAAIYWMLLGFCRQTWAFVGGIVAALHPQLLDWTQIYWGGSVAVIGGAFLLASWGRLVKAITTPACIGLAIGLIILANSRPFEGLVLSLPLLAAIIIRHRRRCRRLLVPTGIPLLLAATAMGYYNFRITGHPWRLPYLEYESQYEIYPSLWILPTRPIPIYHNPAMEYVHRYFKSGAYYGFHTFEGAITHSKYRFNLLFTTNLNLAILLLPFSVALLTQTRQYLVWVMFSAAGLILALWTEIFVFPHYIAPMLPAAILFVVVGWERLHQWNRNGRPLGKTLARATAIGFLAGACMAAAGPIDRDPDLLDQKSTAQLFPQLRTGRHLIFVSYAPMHSYHAELVHNLSNLDESQIIWARSLGPRLDQLVAHYFSARKIWSLHVGGKMDLQPWNNGP